MTGMADFDTAPLFIVGPPRSGTSLVRDLVRRCDGLYLPPDETQFLPAYIEKAGAVCDGKAMAAFLDRTTFSMHMRSRGLWPARRELTELLADPRPAAAIPALMRNLAEREGVRKVDYWGDKTPDYVFHLRAFRRVFPQMRVLVVMRDPREAVLSAREAWGRSLVRGAVIWRDSARAARLFLNSETASSAMAVRYEELVAAPAETMARIANWFGVEFSAEVLESYVGEEKWGTARGHKGVVNPDAARFRKRLRPSEIERIEQVAFDEMTAWGYIPERAKGVVAPGRIQLPLVRVGDGFCSLAHFMRERGAWDGFLYKVRQLRTRRKGSNG